MLYKDICYLGKIQQIENEYGDFIESIVYSEQHQFINVKSIGYREFYEAQATGFKPALKLEMSNHSYSMEEYVKYNNIEYRVIRTYQKNLDAIELVLERGINVGS